MLKQRLGRFGGAMLGMDGHGLVRKLARRGRHLPVVLMSGCPEYHADADSAGPGSELEAAYLEKPFAPEDLLRRVRRVLDRAGDRCVAAAAFCLSSSSRLRALP